MELVLEDARSVERFAPRGPQTALEEALKFLEPFDDDESVKSRRFAISEIEKLARRVNYHRAKERDAPRTGAALSQVERVNQLAADLYESLLAMDPLIRNLILGLNTRSSSARENFDFEAFLGLLSDFIRETFFVHELMKLKYPPDVGGNTNQFKLTKGTSAMILVQYGLLLFDRFQPGLASATESGKFHRFLMAIFSFATNKPGDNVTLLRLMRDFVKALRDRREAEQDHEAIFDQIEKLKAATSHDPFLLDKLEKELKRAEDTMSASWLRLFPQLEHSQLYPPF